MAEGERPAFLTAREVAELLRVRRRRVYELAAKGGIPCRRVTGKLLFPRTEIEAWLAGRPAGPEAGASTGGRTSEMGAGVGVISGAGAREAPRPAAPPEIIVGSHDPLLEWALRESESGLASFFDGSLDGLARLARSEAVAAGLHVFEPEDGGWNVRHLRAAADSAPVVLLEWARRRRGLILARGLERDIRGLGDLAGRRIAMRQAGAGSAILFSHLLATEGLAADDLVAVEPPARTEAEAAALVAEGLAEAAPGLESMARQFGLPFLPLAEERYDIAILRRAFFEPRWQRLVAFTRTERFVERAAALGGYDLAHQWRVHWNGP